MPETEKAGSQGTGILKAYSTDPQMIGLVVFSVYEEHRRTWITLKQFHEVVVKACHKDATVQGATVVLRALIRKGVFKQDVVTGTEFVRVSNAGIDFTERIYKQKIRADDDVEEQDSAPVEKAVDFKVKIAELRVQVSKLQEAEKALQGLEDEAKLKQA